MDERQLPASGDGVRGTVPIVSPLPAFSQWQIVDHTGSEVVIQVDLREPPVQSLPSRKWEVRRPDDTPEAVSEPGVIGSRVGVSDQRVETVSRTLRLGFDL